MLKSRNGIYISRLSGVESRSESTLRRTLRRRAMDVTGTNVVTALGSEYSMLTTTGPGFKEFSECGILTRRVSLPTPVVSHFSLVFMVRSGPDGRESSRLTRRVLGARRFGAISCRVRPRLLEGCVTCTHGGIGPELARTTGRILGRFCMDAEGDGPRRRNTIPVATERLRTVVHLSRTDTGVGLGRAISGRSTRGTIELRLTYLERINISPRANRVSTSVMDNKAEGSRESGVGLMSRRVGRLRRRCNKRTPLGMLVSGVDSGRKVDRSGARRVIEGLIRGKIVCRPAAKCFGLTWGCPPFCFLLAFFA